MNKKDIPAWMREFKNLVKLFNNLVVELLYPSTCVLCGKPNKDSVCAECRKKYPLLKEPLCMCCGKPILEEEREYCEDCSEKLPKFTQGRSLWLHKGEVKQSIYQFKFHNRRIYGKTYGRLLAKRYERYLVKWKIDCIIPVPIHSHRRRKRGYNQAEVLAKALQSELETNIPIKNQLLYRKKETIFQKKLDNKQRKRNLRGAFGVNDKGAIQGNILVIDDIYTTGATLNEIAMVLKKNGANNVYFLTISIGQGF